MRKGFFYLFWEVGGLISESETMMLSDRIIGKESNINDLEGSNYGLIEVLSQHFLCGTEQHH
jgi:hypothetical protein